MHSAALRPTPTQQQPIPEPRPGYGKPIGLSVVLAIITSLLYLPIVHDPFTNIDDQGYVYENLHVQAGLTWETIRWAAGTLDDNNWHPLTWISHAVDCELFGIDPAGHHAMAIFYHSLDAVVLFWVLLLATGFIGRSFMVAALFALHPINVESVAWAAERKTLLSTLFFLLALGSYRWYARQPGVMRYGVMAALFALGLMAKPQIITFPAVLLLWDYWPLRRMFAGQPDATRHSDPRPPLPERSFWWLISEKIPLLLLCAGSALATMKAQHVAHIQNWQYSGWIRIGNAIVAYVRYMGKALWPSPLAIMYLHPGNSLRFWWVAVAGLILLIITALIFVMRQYRYLPVGWLWFLGTLVPTIGLIQVGRQALADRYAYQSFLGLFIIACWGVSDWVRRKQFPKALLPAVSVSILVVVSMITHRQIGYWRDNLTLWSHDAQVTDRNWMAEDMVGGILLNSGRGAEAMTHFYAAAAINPTDERSNLAIAIDEQNHGRLEQAIQHYKMALREMGDPLEEAKAYQNLAVAYRDVGNIPKSVECLRKAVQLRKMKP